MPLPAYKVIALWEGLLQKCSTLTGFKNNCYKNAASWNGGGLNERNIP
jgi:hypothetical protein